MCEDEDTYKEEPRYWDPKRKCPAYQMICERARKQGLCKGGTPELEQTCHTFRCVQCMQEVPFSFGAADRFGACCDACADALGGKAS